MSSDPVTNPVDYILLSNQRSPGLAEVSAANSPRRWDERAGFALSGSRVVFRGIGLSRPIVTLRLYTPQDWADWHVWKVLLMRPPIGERAHALDIWHPFLEDLGVTSVVVEDVLQPRQTADGEWSIDIKFIEYRNPTLMLDIPDGSAESTADPVDTQIEQLSAQVQELANE